MRRRYRKLGYRVMLLRDLDGRTRLPDVMRDRQVTADSCRKPKMEILAKGWTASERVFGV